MTKTSAKPQNDPSTEEKIKLAARQVFHQKGFAATRTRDIAEAAGINLALLNYYFRSKEKLFDLIMLETMQHFMSTIATVVNTPDSTFQQKLEDLASNYIDLFSIEPEMPLFIMSELRSNPNNLLDHIRPKEFLMHSAFVQQFQQAIKEKIIPPQPFLQFMMNLLGLIIFPFIASPMFRNMGDLNESQYAALLQERKKMIPFWIKAMLSVKPYSSN
jgi:AcrR family transcriptional regulator